MKYLNKEQLTELDRKIDSRISTFNLLKRPKDQALYSVLTYFDRWMEERGKDLNLARRKNLYRRSYEGLNHLIQWIHDLCPQMVIDSNSLIDIEAMEEVAEVFHESMEYSTIWVQMSMLWKDRNKCRIIESNYYEISPASLRSGEYESARQILANTKRHPKNPEDAASITFHNRQYVKKRIKITELTASTFNYSFSPEAYSLLASAITQRSLLEWQMDQGWDLGGYTYEQLKIFWLTLQSLCVIHETALELITNPKKCEVFQIRIMSRDIWVQYLSQWSKLSKEVVKQILCDLTYDEKLYRSKEHKPHVMYQPFFRFADGKFGVSNKIVQISNIERNVWSLLSLIRPEIHSRLGNLKENHWIQEFQKDLESKRLKSFSDIKYKLPSTSGNIDLLIIDERSKFGLVCELKWLTATDDVNGTKSNDEQIVAGIGQAERALKWVQCNTHRLAERINFNADELAQFEFKPLVICRDTLLSGYVEKPVVPVIDQQLFDWVIGESNHRDLSSLWDVANSLSYLPKLGVHYEHLEPVIEWGEIRCLLKDVAVKPLERWAPETDITF